MPRISHRCSPPATLQASAVQITGRNNSTPPDFMPPHQHCHQGNDGSLTVQVDSPDSSIFDASYLCNTTNHNTAIHSVQHAASHFPAIYLINSAATTFIYTDSTAATFLFSMPVLMELASLLNQFCTMPPLVI